jgi:hypothetical protein
MTETKTCIAAAATLLFTATSLAHAEPAAETPADAGADRGGVKLGLSLANIDTVEDGYSVDSDLKPGLALGGYVQIHLGGYVSLQPEIWLSSKGAAFAFADEDESIHAGLDFWYLEPALLLSGRIPRNGGVEPFYFAGPYAALLLDAERWAADGWGHSDSEDIEDQVTSHDLGVVAGGGIRVPLWGRGLTFEFRYQRGFVDVVRDEDDDGGGPEINNHAYNFLAGMTF